MQNRWTRDQLLVALRLYMRTPFGRLHGGNPEIIRLAKKIGRTPDAFAMKTCNFASIDPKLNRKGLKKGGKLAKQIWAEFENNPERLAVESEEAFARLDPSTASRDLAEIQLPPGETETERVVRARRVQSFFRAAVLTSYDHRCAISGLAVPELLVASHIIPWSQNVERRADPTNGLCLNALFDRAFDRGLMSFDENLRVIVSKQLTTAAAGAELRCSLDDVAGRELRLPERFRPDGAAIEFHRNEVFKC